MIDLQEKVTNALVAEWQRSWLPNVDQEAALPTSMHAAA